MRKGLLYVKATFVVLSLFLCLSFSSPFSAWASEEEEGGVCMGGDCAQQNSACVCNGVGCAGCKIPNGETGCGRCAHKPSLGD